MSDGIGLSDCQFGDLRAFFILRKINILTIYLIFNDCAICTQKLHRDYINYVFTNVYTYDIIISSKGDTRKELNMIYETTIGRFKVQAKVYDTGSQYGIDEGRISKLWIWDQEKPLAIYTYDRGYESITKGYEKEVAEIKNNLVKFFK